MSNGILNSILFVAGSRLLAITLLAAAWAPLPAQADIMDTCTAEIANYCPTVVEGRGRIAACLFAHSDQTAGACLADIEVLMQSRTAARFMPSSGNSLAGTELESELDAACATDAGRLCPKIDKGGQKLLACLYAYQRDLTGDCQETSKRVTKALQ